MLFCSYLTKKNHFAPASPACSLCYLFSDRNLFQQPLSPFVRIRRIFDITNEDSILGTSRDQCTCKEETVKNEEGVCLRCPSFATCLSGTTIPTLDIERGAWRVSNTSMDVLECPIEVACPGGPGTTTQCNEGYQGILCASCEQNYFYHKV